MSTHITGTAFARARGYAEGWVADFSYRTGPPPSDPPPDPLRSKTQQRCARCDRVINPERLEPYMVQVSLTRREWRLRCKARSGCSNAARRTHE